MKIKVWKLYINKNQDHIVYIRPFSKHEVEVERIRIPKIYGKIEHRFYIRINSEAILNNFKPIKQIRI